VLQIRRRRQDIDLVRCIGRERETWHDRSVSPRAVNLATAPGVLVRLPRRHTAGASDRLVHQRAEGPDDVGSAEYEGLVGAATNK
jgi:hypothetical protein